MIVECKTWQDFENKRRDFSPRYIRLLDQNKNILISYNQGIKDFDLHLKEIEKFYNSVDLPPGVYYIEVRRIRKTEGIFYKITKLDPTGAPPPPIAPNAEQKTKTMIVDDNDLLELRVSNERYILEIAALKKEIDELNEYIDELENDPAPLEDSGAPKWLDTLKDLLPTIADPVLGEWRRMNDIKQAQIGYNYELLKMQQNQTKPDPMPEYKKDPQNLTFEELESARKSAPNDFYTWISNEENRQYYETLKLENETGI